jgi:quinol monooxygenase YgiN
MIYVIATLTIKPGSKEALEAPAAACIAETRKEKGCISYELFASMHDPEKLVFVEQWESREALTAHSKQPHLQAWRDASAPHLVERRIEVVHPDRVEQF